MEPVNFPKYCDSRKLYGLEI